jgi:hypothetical protein
MIDRIRSAIVFGNSDYLEPGDVQWIDMANVCQAYHCLPRPGGYFDQDPADLHILTMIELAREERREFDANKRKGALPHHPG